MLIGIPPAVSPELLDVLMRMGHGDEIVLADANFPADSIAAGLVHKNVVSLSGAGIAVVLGAVLRLMPLDTSVEQPAMYMGAPAELGQQPIHGQMLSALEAVGYGPAHICPLARFEFYERAKSAYAVVRTSETARFGNIILKKGIVPISR
jgi:L-fucose mutarotase